MPFITSIFSWLNDQLLKMTWLYDLVRLLVENVFGLPVPAAGQAVLTTNERIGGSIHFFIYDTIKIFILLSFLILSNCYI